MELRGAVGADARQVGAIRSVGEFNYGSVVGLQSESWRSISCVPDPDCAVVTTSGEAVAVRAERDSSEAEVFGGDRLDGGTAESISRQIPHGGGAVPTDCR